MDKTKSILRLAISIALAFTFSCSSNDPNGGTSSPSRGGGIVNADDEAWLRIKSEYNDGLIFKPNGELISIMKSKKMLGNGVYMGNMHILLAEINCV